MWSYEKRLEFPVNISKRDLNFAKEMINAVGGPAGELAAAIRYLMQAPTMPDKIGQNLLLEIATEELGHVEILMAMFKQLTAGATIEEISSSNFEPYYVEHGLGIYPIDSLGNPFSASYLGVTGNPIADLNEDLAAEAKAKAGYENLMNLTNNEEILAPLSFLREREIVHYQRFAEALKHYQNKLEIK